MKRNSNRSIVISVLLFLYTLFIASTCRAQAFRIPANTASTPKSVQKKEAEKKDTVAAKPSENAGKKEEPEIKNIKVLSEQSDGKGNIVRVIQYNKGMLRITETIIKPKTPSIGGYGRPINPDTMDKKEVLLVVEKSKYTVEVLYRRRPIRMYRATFGPQPKMNKCMEGDRCTPEGSFTITNLNPRSPYNKFMLLSYPDSKDWERFNELKKEGKIPTSAKIGGSIGIHGIWKGGDQLIDLGVGWTDGCVALKNNDVDELYSLVGIGTKVVIRY